MMRKGKAASIGDMLYEMRVMGRLSLLKTAKAMELTPYDLSRIENDQIVVSDDLIAKLKEYYRTVVSGRCAEAEEKHGS